MKFRVHTTIGALAVTVLAGTPFISSARATGLPPSALPGVKAVEEVQRMVMPVVDVGALRTEDL